MEGAKRARGYEVYQDWIAAEIDRYAILDAVKEDSNHADYLVAQDRAERLLEELLRPSESLVGVLTKLLVACEFEGYEQEATGNQQVAPRAIIGAVQDLQRMLSDSDDQGDTGWGFLQGSKSKKTLE